jgi:hypothetical protein
MEHPSVSLFMFLKKDFHLKQLRAVCELEHEDSDMHEEASRWQMITSVVW